MSTVIQKKTRVSIILPQALYEEMIKKMKATGYGLRKISVWVTEALDALLSTASFPELVKIGDSMSQFKKVLLIILEDDAYARLNNAVVDVRAEFPAMEGVKSRILRTAIIQRLLRE